MSEEKQEHRWGKPKRHHHYVCLRCDLVWLKNPATERRVRAGCIGQLVEIKAPKSANQKAADEGR